MAERPKRSRKIVNYGEDHLHWVEETQLQKALLRSLNEKESPAKKLKVDSNQICKDPDEPSSITGMCDADSSPDERKNEFVTEKSPKKKGRKKIQKNLSQTLPSPRPEDSFELRLTRLQSKLLEEAGMYGDDDVADTKSSPDDSPSTSSGEKVVTRVSKDSSDIDGSPISNRVRAQRKFASNASPPQTRSNSPVKMNKPKVNESSGKTRGLIAQKVRAAKRTGAYGRAVRACSSEEEPLDESTSSKQKSKSSNPLPTPSRAKYARNLFDGVPKTDDFLTYLCFRNTPVKVELFDFAKSKDNKE